MPKMYSVSINSIRIPYSFQCENCGKQHTRTCIKTGATEVGLSPEGAQKKALESVNKIYLKLRNAADRGDFSWISTDTCPDCGYTQSWQKKAEKSETRYITLGFILLIVLDLACISGLFLGTPNALAWILAGLFLVCTGLLLRTLILRKRRIGQSPRANQSYHPEVEWPNPV
jgi:predicted RNA-binding Zn-ribbon protein involved in translation (DUF1610 family)